MTVRVERTPNPNATKFTVGAAVGGPGTYVKGSEPEEEFLQRLLEIEGVASVFLTADFVTISKTATSSWGSIVSQATAILEGEFSEGAGS